MKELSLPLYLFISYFSYMFGLLTIYFILWVLIQSYPNLLCCWNSSSFHYWGSLRLVCVLRLAPIFYVCLFFMYFFTAPKDVPGSSCIFSTLALKEVTSPRNYTSFQWRVVFRNQDVGVRCACAYWAVMASRSSQWTEVESIRMYINPWHPHLYLFLYLSACVYFFN